jgi:O-succinylbenzoate synthase
MTDAIARIRLVRLQIPLKEPYRVAEGELAAKDAILVQMETAGGLVGLGECSPVDFAPATTPLACWEQLRDRIAPSLIGREIRDAEGIADLAKGWAGACSFSVAGAETACWDLLAQSRHEILAETLGASEESINAGVESGLAVGLYPTVVEMVRAIEAHLPEGYRRLKIRIARGQDLELVRSIRRHFGEIDLMVDAGAAYGPNDIDLFRALDEFDLLMIEQPYAAHDLDGLAALQSAIETPICLDETATDPATTLRAIEMGAGQIVNLKLQRVGGFGPALEILELCRRHDVPCWVGTSPELGVGQAHGLHLAAMPNIRYPTDIEPSARWFVDDYIEPPLELGFPGRFRVPTRPGLGFLVDAARLQRPSLETAEITE